MSENGQTHFKNLAANAARLLKCVWPFRDIMHLSFNETLAVSQIFRTNSFIITEASVTDR